MPKLLQINALCNWGSTGKIAEQIGEKAISEGWEVWLAHGGRFVRPSKMKTIQIESKIADYWHFLWNSFILGHHGLGSALATKRLVDKIKQINPDIIHLHNLHGYYLNYKVLFEYLNKANIPVVWTLHDTWAFCGHCGHFGSINCEKWKTECNHCPLKLNDYPKSLIDHSREDYQLKKELFTTNKNLHIVTVSKWLSEVVKQSFLQDKDIMVINNGVDLNAFRVLPFVSLEKQLVLGVSSQWGELKGLNDFYKLRKRLDIEQYDIKLIGLTKQQIKELPFGINGVERTNSIFELIQAYSDADVFVNPTYADTFPTVNIEALACGTPVVTYNTGGSPEILEDVVGYVAERGSIESLVKGIEKFCSMTKAEKETVKEKCRLRAVTNYDKNMCFEKYIELYNILINNKLIGGGKLYLIIYNTTICSRYASYFLQKERRMAV